ncbi:MAG TPA: hypothetical protein VEY49_00020 [Solirubrobacteraceae bacterium]|nr:hypothetical protein [Solirubrobacteraceae bacterium]
MREEVRRRDEPALGILPAHERLDPAQPAARQLVQRLEVKDELVLGECSAQPRGKRQLAARLARTPASSAT